MNKEELKQKFEKDLTYAGTLCLLYDDMTSEQLWRWIKKNILSELEKEIERIITEAEDQHPYKQLGNRDSYSEYNEGWSDACDVIRQSIIPTEEK